MATLNITAPDGKVLNIDVPAGTDPSKYDSIVDEVVKDYSSQSQDPGLLKSAAAGVMSGIPLAETAISGVGSALTDKSYSDIHKGLEDLKDKAWEQHPVAYGTGKVAGIAGTGLVAPEVLGGLGVENAIGQAAIQGAGYGADLAAKPSDLPMEAAKGTAAGAVAGTIGEKVLNPLISKIPGLGQKVVSSLVPGENAAQAVETRLTNPEVLANAKSPTQAADVLENLMNDIKTATGHLSEKAKSTLSPGSMVDYQTEVAPILEAAKQKFLISGQPTGEASQSGLATISNWEKTLERQASVNGGRIPDTVMADIVRAVHGDINWNPLTATAQTDASGNALKDIGHGLNEILKNKNDNYATAMQPVSELADLSKQVAKNFNIQKVGGKLEATDTTNQKLSNILNENKTNAQDVLKKFSDLTGYDFLGNAKNYELNESFGAGKSTPAIQNALTMLGYGVGHQTNVPMGGLVGAATARIMGREVDGGAIAASIIDQWMNPNSVLGETRAAVQKFGPILANAAKSGGNSLAATHFVLATSNPEYQDLIDKSQSMAGQ